MGNSNSSSVTQTMSEFNTNMVSALSSTVNSTAQNIMTNQTVTVNIGCPNITNFLPTVQCTNLSVTNTANVTADLTSTFSTSNEASVLSAIKAAVDATAASTNKVVSGFLNTSIASSSSSTTDVKTEIKNLAETNITQLVTNSCQQNTNVIQNNTVNICANIVANNCNFGNSAQLWLSANCVSSTLQSIIANNSALSTAFSNAAATNDVQNTGLEGVINAIGGIFGSVVFGYVIVFGLIILGVLGLTFLVTSFFKPAPPSSQSAFSTYPSSYQAPLTTSSEGYPVSTIPM